MNLDKLEELVSRQKPRFAGWFSECKSAMSYRLWEQGGYEQQPGDVALYESECGLSHDTAKKLIAVARAAKELNEVSGDEMRDRFWVALAALRAALEELPK